MRNRLFRTLGGLFGKPLDLSAYSADCITVCPAEEQSVRPAIYLEHHLSRVSGVDRFSTMELQFRWLHDPIIYHAATRLYRIGPVKLFRGGLATRRREVLLRKLPESHPRSAVHLSRALLADSDFDNLYFGHWLHDFVPATLLAADQRPVLVFCKPPYPHAADYSRLLNLETTVGNAGSIEDLHVVEDFSQNSHKVARYRELRSRLAAKTGSAASCGCRGVFIARGKGSDNRLLANEDALVEHLIRRGFDAVWPETMSAEALMRRLWNAPMIIAVEGSALGHALYPISPTGAYLVLQPPRRFNNISKGICDAVDRPYGFYVCQPAGKAGEFIVDSFSDLDRVIDLLGNERTRRTGLL